MRWRVRVFPSLTCPCSSFLLNKYRAVTELDVLATHTVNGDTRDPEFVQSRTLPAGPEPLTLQDLFSPEEVENSVSDKNVLFCQVIKRYFAFQWMIFLQKG